MGGFTPWLNPENRFWTVLRGQVFRSRARNSFCITLLAVVAGEERCGMVRAEPVTEMQQGFTLIELMIVVSIVGMLSAIAIPLYQNFVARSQVSRILAETSGAKTAVSECLILVRTVVGIGVGECNPSVTGSSLLVGGSQAGAVLPANTGVPQISNPVTINSTIVATFGNSAAAALTAGPAVLTLTRQSDGSWICTTTAPSNVRPVACQ